MWMFFPHIYFPNGGFEMSTLLTTPGFGFPGWRPPRKRKRRPRRQPHPVKFIKKARFRSRVTPDPSGSQSVHWGTYFIEVPANSGNWIKFFDLEGRADLPYLKAESCMDEVHGGPPFINGGPFRKITITPFGLSGLTAPGTYISNYEYQISGFGYGKVKYVGRFGGPSSFPGATEDVLTLGGYPVGLGPQSAIGANSPLVPSTSTLDSRVWDSTKPKIEMGGLAVALAEIRDVPHMLKTTAKGFSDAWRYLYKANPRIRDMAVMPKKAADHFVNHNFGYVPFIKDLSNLCDNIIKLDRRIDHLMKDNGDWHRRKAILVNNSDTVKVYSDSSWYLGVYPTNTQYLQSCMTGPPSIEVWRNKWSYAEGVGRFRYYQPYLDERSPESEGMLGALRRQLALHGARLTPANIYRATPWTWLIDWVTDSGHVVNAINDFAVDGLVAKYLYLIHHQILTYSYKQITPFNAASGGVQTLQWDRIIDVKQRKEAESPFGFGVHWDNLSPKQVAILAALGIMRT
jgi:hypothetical protein